jgi:hypothetical protein
MATSTNTEETAGMVDSAKQAAVNALGQAKDQAASRADQQRQTLASGLQAVAQAFQSMGENLGQQEGGPVAQYAAEMGQAVGSQVNRLANYLRERDLSQLVTEVEGFARRSPAVFLGSAFLLGLAASRFLKSSRPLPDFLVNIPDPSHALPPASTPTANPENTPTSLATTSSASSPSAVLGSNTSPAGGI